MEDCEGEGPEGGWGLVWILGGGMGEGEGEKGGREGEEGKGKKVDWHTLAVEVVLDDEESEKGMVAVICVGLS